MKRIAKNFKGYVSQLILGPIFKLMEAVMELFVPLVMAHLIDVGIHGDMQLLWHDGLLLLALAVGSIVMAITCQYFAATTASFFGRGLRAQIYAHVMRLSADESETFGAGGLINRITNDTNQIQAGVNMFIRLATRVPFLAIGGIVMAMLLNWRMGLIFLCATPFIALALFVIMRSTLPSYGKIQSKQDDLARLSGENLAGARVIRAFSRQEDEKAELEASANELTQLVVRVGRISAVLNPLTSLIVAFAIVGIVQLGANLVFSSQSTPGEVIAMISYMSQILLAMIVGANLVVLFTRAAASVKRVSALLETQPSITDGPGAKALPDAPAIAFNHVNFHYYAGAARALEDVSFSIPRGSTVGIIGGTGSGKSTLANLMLRQYDAQDGTVQCGGVDVRQYTLSGLRAQFGLVPQTAVLFSGTVRHNLQLGAPNATDDEIWQALQTAQAADFVGNMPEGLNADIAEGGKNLSGGQKQRLAIARALVKNPDILVLDDAASALDYATDARLRKTLRQRQESGEDSAVKRVFTTIIISQRASSIRHADMILVMDDGMLAGSGTHDALLKENDIYREICASQGITTSVGHAK